MNNEASFLVSEFDRLVNDFTASPNISTFNLNSISVVSTPIDEVISSIGQHLIEISHLMIHNHSCFQKSKDGAGQVDIGSSNAMKKLAGYVMQLRGMARSNWTSDDHASRAEANGDTSVNSSNMFPLGANDSAVWSTSSCIAVSSNDINRILTKRIRDSPVVTSPQSSLQISPCVSKPSCEPIDCGNETGSPRQSSGSPLDDAPPSISSACSDSHFSTTSANFSPSSPVSPHNLNKHFNTPVSQQSLFNSPLSSNFSEHITPKNEFSSSPMTMSAQDALSVVALSVDVSKPRDDIPQSLPHRAVGTLLQVCRLALEALANMVPKQFSTMPTTDEDTNHQTVNECYSSSIRDGSWAGPLLCTAMIGVSHWVECHPLASQSLFSSSSKTLSLLQVFRFFEF